MNNISKKLLILSLPLAMYSNTIEYIPDTFLQLNKITDKKVTDIMDKDNSCSLFFGNSIFCSKKSIKEETIKLYLFDKENSQGTVFLKVVDYIAEKPKKEEPKETNEKDWKKNILNLKKEKFSLIKENKELKSNLAGILEKNRVKLEECTINDKLKKENKRLETEIRKISDLLKREKTKSKEEHFKLISKLDELSKERKLFQDNSQSEQVILLNTQLKNLLSENTNLKNQVIELKHSNKNLTTILKKKEEVIEQYKRMLALQKANKQQPQNNGIKVTKKEEPEEEQNDQMVRGNFFKFLSDDEPEKKEPKDDSLKIKKIDTDDKSIFDIFN